MKALVCLTIDLPDVEDIGEVLRAIDPPNVPFFDKEIRVVLEPHATAVTTWLDKESKTDGT